MMLTLVLVRLASSFHCRGITNSHLQSPLPSGPGFRYSYFLGGSELSIVPDLLLHNEVEVPEGEAEGSIKGSRRHGAQLIRSFQDDIFVNMYVRFSIWVLQEDILIMRTEF